MRSWYFLNENLFLQWIGVGFCVFDVLVVVIILCVVWRGQWHAAVLGKCSELLGGPCSVSIHQHLLQAWRAVSPSSFLSPARDSSITET